MVKIDKGKCIECGACAATCPEGFEMKDGKSVVLKEAPCSKEAAAGCPTGAISV